MNKKIEDPPFYIFQSPLMGNMFCSLFSFLGSIFVIISFLFIRNLRSITFYLIFLISISECINSFAHLFSIEKLWDEDKKFISNSLCTIQRHLIVITDTCTLVILSLISYNIYRLVMKNDRELINKKNLFIILGPLIGILLSVIILAIFYCFNGNQDTENRAYCSWCWVIYNKQIVDYHEYTPFIIVCIFYTGIVCYIVITIMRVINFIKKKKKSRQNLPALERISVICKKLYNYLFVGTIWWAFTLINLIFPYKLQIRTEYDLSELEDFSNRLKFIIITLMGMFTCIRGFFIALVFYNNTKVQEVVKKLVKNFLGVLMNKREINADDKSNYTRSVIEQDPRLMSLTKLDATEELSEDKHQIKHNE